MATVQSIRQHVSEAQKYCFELGTVIAELEKAPASDLSVKCRQLKQLCSQTGNALERANEALGSGPLSY